MWVEKEATSNHCHDLRRKSRDIQVSLCIKFRKTSFQMPVYQKKKKKKRMIKISIFISRCFHKKKEWVRDADFHCQYLLSVYFTDNRWRKYFFKKIHMPENV